MGDLIDQSSNGKIIRLEYDFVHSRSADRCLYCLTAQQVEIILTLLAVAKWGRRWYSYSGAAVDMDWVDKTVSSLETELMTDHCDIQAQIDEINNNIVNISNNIVTINNNIVDISTVLNTYNSYFLQINNTLNLMQIDITNILIQNNTTNYYFFYNFFVTFTSNSQDSGQRAIYARYNAFCQGILDWIYAEFYAVTSGLGADEAITGAIITLMSAATSILYGIVNHGNPGDYTVTVLFDAINSESDVFAVACAMITYLKDKPHTADTFALALASFTPANSNQIAIATTLQAAIIFQDAFLSFAANEELEYDIAYSANPTGYVCPPCGAVTDWATIPQDWNFAALNLLPWVIDRGILVSGAGIDGVQIIGDTNYAVDVSIYFPTPTNALATHTLKYHTAHLPTGGSQWVLELWKAPLTGGTPVLANTFGTSQVASWPNEDTQTRVIGSYGPTDGLYRIRIHSISPYYGNVGQSNASRISRIEFTA